MPKEKPENERTTLEVAEDYGIPNLKRIIREFEGGSLKKFNGHPMANQFREVLACISWTYKI